MSSRRPEHRIAVAVNAMHWRDLTFLHWPVNPARIRPLLPPELQVDTFDDVAWVGVTPFRMSYFGAPAVRLPIVPAFTEINVRTYVRGRDGRDGVWFFSLECSRLPVTALLRLLGLPYEQSATDQRRRSGQWHYTSRRRSGHAWFGARVAVGQPIATPTEFEDFLTGRWNGYSRAWGQVWRTPIEHEPWPLHRADAECAPAQLLSANGLPQLEGQPIAHFSPLVHVRVGPPRPG
ncbi:MAG TPA: DUF2071 domain-containing protein [Beutenbergiaceae bacterium]|nr:DUF2071 domain-containing protein [Beutenbergiaceae bacterium]